MSPYKSEIYLDEKFEKAATTIMELDLIKQS